MTDYLESKGRHLIGWDEILQGGLAKGAAVLSWCGASGGASAAAIGHNVVMARDSYFYIDYNQFPGDDIYIHSYCDLLMPIHCGCSHSPMEGIPAESHKYVIGVQVCMWTDTVCCGELDMLYKVFPRAAALAEIGWSPESSKMWMRFGAAYVRAMGQRFEAAQIEVAPLALGDRALWAPAIVPATYEMREWRITGAVPQKGAFEGMFVLMGGSNKLAVKNVKILFGDRVVTADDHEGAAGEGVASLWSQNVDKDYAPEVVYLRADVDGVDGTDSFGEAVVYYLETK